MKILRILFVLILTYAIFSFAFKDDNAFKLKGLIPKNIEVTKLIEVNDNTLCKTAIFELSHLTIDNIRKKSLAAFVDSHHARNYENDRDRLYNYYTYGSWKETPFPTPTTELAIREIWPSACSSEDRNLLNKINNSLKVLGSYYAVIQDGGLIIIPDLGLAIVTYFNN